MAVVKYGSLVSEIKGKIGSVVFQKCGQSFSIRTQASRNYGKFDSNYLSRLGFSQISAEWNALSSAGKAVFSANASSFPTYDKYGNAVVLTGYQLFVYLNRVMLTAGEPLVTASFAYTPPTTGMFGLGNPDITSRAWQIYFYTANSAYEEYMIYCSPPHPSNSVKAMENMRFITKFRITTLGNQDIDEALFTKFKVQPKVGDTMRVLIRTHNYYNGSYSDQVHPNVDFVASE